jgi:hypothetical protein
MKQTGTEIRHGECVRYQYSLGVLDLSFRNGTLSQLGDNVGHIGLDEAFTQRLISNSTYNWRHPPKEETKRLQIHCSLLLAKPFGLTDFQTLRKETGFKIPFVILRLNRFFACFGSLASSGKSISKALRSFSSVLTFLFEKIGR